MDFKDEAVCNAREAGIELRENEPLAAHTSFRIGGPARWMAFPKTVEEVRTLLCLAREADIPCVCSAQGRMCSHPMRAWTRWCSV